MRPPRSRRRVLGLLAASALPLGGCLSNRAPGESTASPGTDTTPTSSGPVTRSPGDTHETSEGWSLTVENVHVRHGVVKAGVAHLDPVWVDGAQFVVADVAVAGDGAPDVTDLPVFARTGAGHRSDRYYVHAESNTESRQRFGYPVQTDPAPDGAAVVWSPDGGPAVRWVLESEHVEALGHAPDFAVESFETPATAVDDDEFETTLRVSNGGERDATFLAEVGNALVSDQSEVELDVPAGETVTGRPSVNAHFGDREELRVVLRWAGGTVERTVERR